LIASSRRRRLFVAANYAIFSYSSTHEVRLHHAGWPAAASSGSARRPAPRSRSRAFDPARMLNPPPPPRPLSSAPQKRYLAPKSWVPSMLYVKEYPKGPEEQ
jgi:hypothetical protein